MSKKLLRSLDRGRVIERIALNRMAEAQKQNLKTDKCPRCKHHADSCYPCRMLVAVAIYATRKAIDKMVAMN